MWDSLPWFVQLAIEVGAVVFLYNVVIEGVLRTVKIIALLKGMPLAEIEKDQVK